MSATDCYGKNHAVENMHSNHISVQSDMLYMHRKKSPRSQRKSLVIVICDRGRFLYILLIVQILYNKDYFYNRK